MKTHTMLKLSEVFLKSRRTQKELFDLLFKNVRALGLNPFRKRTRIFVEGFDPKLKNVFGIESICVGTFTDKPSEYIIKILKNKNFNTFKVKCKRHNKKLEFTSIDFAKYIGKKILESFPEKKVDLNNPDITIHIEIFDKNDFFVYFNEIKGFGGLPLGSQGKGICLLSTGIDSPVAAFLAMKRGIKLDFIHFKIDENSKIKKVFEKIKEYAIGYEPKLIIIDHKEFLEKNKEKAEKYLCILCKRRMLKKASEIGKKIGSICIINGDNLGQVATQTLKNLSIINEASNLLVLRPLICFNKQEIIDLSKKLGFYDLFEDKDCPYLPGKVVTECNLEKIKKLESPIELIIEGKEIIPEKNFKTIKEILEYYDLNPYECVILKNNEIVLPEEEIKENDKIEIVLTYSKG